MTVAHGRRRQHGMAILESLVALAVLGAALLGMLWGQLQTLATSSDSLHRTQAIQLIDDLAERVRASPRSTAPLADFLSEWGAQPDAGVACDERWCDAGALARWDLGRWKQAVSRQLPLGRASTYLARSQDGAAPPRALGVMIGWRTQGSSLPADAARNPVGAGDRPSCPQGWTCHHGLVQR